MASSDLSEVHTLLENGLKEEMAGRKDEARKHYSRAMQILIILSDRETGRGKTRRLQQADAIQQAIDRLNDSTTENSGDPTKTEGKKILKKLGLDSYTVEEVSMKDVVGLEEVKKEIMLRIVYPFRFKELSEEYNISPGGGILLYGPPGNGKTFIVKAIANEIEASFIYVNPASLYSQWFGNFEKNISDLFKAARMLSPTILFFDEIDALASSRSLTDSDVVRRGVSQFLNELGGFSTNSSEVVFVIGATNDPWHLDQAITRPGRLDRLLYVPPPDQQARKIMFANRLSKVKNIGKLDYEAMSKLTSGYSAADIDYVCTKASQNVFLDAVKHGSSRPVEQKDVELAISEVKSSVDRTILDRYREFSLAR